MTPPTYAVQPPLQPAPHRSPPHRQAALALAVHLAAVCLWLGVLLATGAAAAIAFPAMKRLAPQVPGFAVPTDEHWLIVGGHFAAPMFLVGEIAGGVLGAAAAASLVWLIIVHRRDAGGAWIKRVHTALFGVAAGLMLFQLVLLSPRMRSNLDEYWSLAKAGDAAPAAAARARFDADHPVASRTLASLATTLAATIAVTVVRMGKATDMP